jgi:hypothetical protein
MPYTTFLDRAAARGLRLAANRLLSVSTDPCQGDPTALALRAAAGRGDWDAVRAVLAQVGDVNTRSFYLSLVAETPGAEKWLAEAVQRDPGNALALLVQGHRLIAWGWEARGYTTSVTRSGAKAFLERLHQAEAVLGEVVVRSPGDADAWNGLLTISRGAGQGLDTSWQRFGRAAAVSPGHVAAHRNMLQQFLAKWGGSNDMARRFAVDTAGAAPEGSPLTALVPEAHIEIWVDGHGGLKHIRNPEVIGEIRQAAARGVGNPAYRPFIGDAALHNLFARAFMNAKLPAEAAPFFRTSDRRVVESVWADSSYIMPPSLIGISYLREQSKAYRKA